MPWPQTECERGGITYRAEGGAISKVRVSSPSKANKAEALHSGVFRELGIALLRTWRCGNDVFNGRLEQLLPGHEADLVAQKTVIHVIYPHARHLSAKVCAFVDYLVETFELVLIGNAMEDLKEGLQRWRQRINRLR